MIRPLAVAWALAVLLVLPSRAGESDAELPEMEFTGTGEAGTGNVGFRFGYYDQPDSGKANPFLDEDLQVIETVFIADYNVNERLSAYGMFAIDIVTSASIGRLDDYPEQTGASGDYYFGLDVGGSYELAADRTVGAFLKASFERDYWSVGYGGNTAYDFNNGNTNLDLAANYYFDTLEIIRYNGDQDEGVEHRHTLTTTVTLRQLLDRRSFGEVGGTFTLQRGFLETPYNGVVFRHPTRRPPFAFANDATGVEQNEEFPKQRSRGAVFGRVRRLLFEPTAVEVGGSYGFDSWEATGWSAETTLHQRLLEDVLNLRLRYRYYEQQESEYYDLTLDAPDDLPDDLDDAGFAPRYRTQDTDFSAYDAHTIGAKFEWQVDEKWLLDIGVDYTIRSDDFDFVFGSFGVRRAFVAPDDWWRAEVEPGPGGR